MLIHIMAAEPGSNLVTQIFQYDRTTKPLGGWVLTVNWYTEEGLPMKGLISLAYSCGFGVRMNGCVPIKRHRQSLIGLVLHRYDFYQYDDSNPSTELTPLPIGGSYTLARANEMLGQLEANIRWNYNPVCSAHE
jgi:hypothetical protein